MTMVDEERLRRLAEVAPLAPARPVAQVRRRGVRIRRVKRVRVGGQVAAALAAAVVLPFAPGPQPSGGRPPGTATRVRGIPVDAVTPVRASGQGALVCPGAYARTVPRDRVPTLSYLLPAGVPGQTLARAWARVEDLGPDCPPQEPQAVLVDLAGDGGHVDRSLNVWGPDEAAGFFGRETDVRVRGVDGRMMTEFEPEGVLTVAWTEPDGSRWFVSSAGLDRDELVDTVDRLGLTGGRVARSGLPSGYDVVVLPRTPTGERRFWHALYTMAQKDEDGDHDGVQLTVSAPAGPPVEMYAAWAVPGTGGRFVEVNGSRAFYSRGRGGRFSSLQWNTTSGLSFRLTAPLGFGETVALARALVHVGPDDPRLAGVPSN